MPFYHYSQSRVATAARITYRNHQEAPSRLGSYCTSAVPLVVPAVDGLSSIKHNTCERFYMNPENHFQAISENHHVVINNHSFAVLDNTSLRLLQTFFLQPTTIREFFSYSGHDGGDNIYALLTGLKGSRVLLSNTPQSDGRQKDQARVLTAWLSITEQCNLSCSYCFQPHNLNYMDESMGESIAKRIIDSAVRHQYSSIEVTYAGGEPLMRFPALLHLHRYMRDLANAAKLKFNAYIVTNAVLINAETIASLKQENIQMIISLDGISDHCNIERKDSLGRPTTKVVMQNIVRCIEAGLKPLVAVTITNVNAKELPELTNWLIDVGARFCFGLYQKTKGVAIDLDESLIIKSMLAAYQVIEQRLPEVDMPLSSLLDQGNLQQPHKMACSAGKDHLVFDSKGELYSCPMQTQPINSAQHRGDIIEIMRADSDAGFTIPIEKKEGCQDCQWKHWCAGGCPINTQRKTGRFDVKSPYCNIYKAIFPQVLRLEGLRML